VLAKRRKIELSLELGGILTRFEDPLHANMGLNHSQASRQVNVSAALQAHLHAKSQLLPEAIAQARSGRSDVQSQHPVGVGSLSNLVEMASQSMSNRTSPRGLSRFASLHALQEQLQNLSRGGHADNRRQRHEKQIRLHHDGNQSSPPGSFIEKGSQTMVEMPPNPDRTDSIAKAEIAMYIPVWEHCFMTFFSIGAHTDTAIYRRLQPRRQVCHRHFGTRRSLAAEQCKIKQKGKGQEGSSEQY